MDPVLPLLLVTSVAAVTLLLGGSIVIPARTGPPIKYHPKGIANRLLMTAFAISMWVVYLFPLHSRIPVGLQLPGVYPPEFSFLNVIAAPVWFVLLVALAGAVREFIRTGWTNECLTPICLAFGCLCFLHALEVIKVLVTGLPSDPGDRMVLKMQLRGDLFAYIPVRDLSVATAKMVAFFLLARFGDRIFKPTLSPDDSPATWNDRGR